MKRRGNHRHFPQFQGSRRQVNKFSGTIASQYPGGIQIEPFLVVAHYSFSIHTGVAINLVKEFAPDGFDL